MCLWCFFKEIIPLTFYAFERTVLSDLVIEIANFLFNLFLGENCTIPNNSCKNHFCENGATCVSTGSSYHCKCAAGFTGKYCRTNIDECSSSPCQHGSCVDGINDYHCSCDAGWTGKDCDENIDFCEDK